MLAEIVEKAERSAGGGNNLYRHLQILQADSNAQSIKGMEPRGNRRINNRNLRMYRCAYICTQEKPKRKSA